MSDNDILFTDPIEKFVLILVPGNFYNNFKKNLLISKWKPISEIDHSKILASKKIIILRDPYERWLEGFSNSINTGIHSNLPKSFIKLYKSEYQTEALELFLSYTTTFCFELSTEMQCKFLEKYVSSAENCVYFFMNDRIGFDINKYLQKFKILTALNNSITKFPLEIFEDYTIIKNFLNSYPELKQRVMSFYETDYNFINTVDFYNTEK